ncbi:MAG: hypothetical protein ABIO70_04945 [Pseudomonadota bacterium]
MTRALTLAALCAASLVLLPACKEDPDDTEQPEADTDTDSDADTDTDTDVPQSMVGYDGEAIAGYDGYDGHEEHFKKADEGAGDDICRVRYELHAKGDPRTDCPDCDWAWDLELTAASIAAESGEGCEGAFGITAENVGGLDGTSFAIGFVSDYYGHGHLFMRDEGEGWAIADWANWDEESGEFSYQWNIGLVD